MNPWLYYTLLALHILGAAIWTGGHLVLALSILPRAWREHRASLIRDFERVYERVGMPALAVQIVTGLVLAYHLLGSPSHWLADTGQARAVIFKLSLLAVTVALALHARLRVIPNLRDDNIPVLGYHIIAVTIIGVLFVLTGVCLRFGGFPFFT